jgi:hypothetical protein
MTSLTHVQELEARLAEAGAAAAGTPGAVPLAAQPTDVTSPKDVTSSKNVTLPPPATSGTLTASLSSPAEGLNKAATSQQQHKASTEAAAPAAGRGANHSTVGITVAGKTPPGNTLAGGASSGHASGNTLAGGASTGISMVAAELRVTLAEREAELAALTARHDKMQSLIKVGEEKSDQGIMCDV